MRYNRVSTPLHADQTMRHRVGLSIKTIPVQPPAARMPPGQRPDSILRFGSGMTPRCDLNHNPTPRQCASAFPITSNP